MKFDTSFSEDRPVRLSETTRAFAYESLYIHKYGIDTRKTPCIDLDFVPDIDSMCAIEQYDVAIRSIAKKAPIRICENEKLTGASTLGDSIDHIVPARRNGEFIFLGISHLTINFEKVLDRGINGIKYEIEQNLLNHTDKEKLRFLVSCKNAVDSFEIWINRYIEALERLEGYEVNIKNLKKVPFSPPESFHEALQSIWAVFAFCRLCGNWPGIGRIDRLLGDYLKNDLKNGILTLSEARELLAHFFIKGCEWIAGGNYVSGDAQHYQNIVLSGCDEDGNDVTNEVTYLVLDIIEELGISDFPTSVRIGKNTPDELLRRVASVIRYGNGVIAVYNEDLVIDALTKSSYSLTEARNFANDGCWEVMVPGKTYFSYFPFDALAVLQRKTLRSYSTELDFHTYEELYKTFIKDIEDQVYSIFIERCATLENKKEVSYVWNENVPCSVISLFEDNCIEKGLSYTNGGTVYTVFSPHIGGIADVANSLQAIKMLVYDKKLITLPGLMQILSNNWNGAEELRRYCLSNSEFYGNDCDSVDAIVSNILSDFADICNKYEVCEKFRFPPGVSTFGRQIQWADARYALPCGQKKGEVLANNMAPAPGTAVQGATAIINSYCKADLSRISNGAALDIRLFPNDVRGEDGINVLCSLIKAFCLSGGFFIQIDIADADILRDAQKNPEKYPALAVRVAGWNARFVTLAKEWQDMIIDNIDKK